LISTLCIQSGQETEGQKTEGQKTEGQKTREQVSDIRHQGSQYRKWQEIADKVPRALCQGIRLPEGRRL